MVTVRESHTSTLFDFCSLESSPPQSNWRKPTATSTASHLRRELRSRPPVLVQRMAPNEPRPANDVNRKQLVGHVQLHHDEDSRLGSRFSSFASYQGFSRDETPPTAGGTTLAQRSRLADKWHGPRRVPQWSTEKEGKARRRPEPCRQPKAWTRPGGQVLPAPFPVCPASPGTVRAVGQPRTKGA